MDDLGDGTVRVYIPALHRDLMPFETETVKVTNENGEPVLDDEGNEVTKVVVHNKLKLGVELARIKEEVMNPSEESSEESSEDESAEEPTTEEPSSPEAENETQLESTKNLVTTTAFNAVEFASQAFTVTIDRYPIARICAWQVRTKLEVGDSVWIMFENGDINFPIIVGQLGTTLPIGGIGKGSRGRSSINSNNATIVKIFNLIVNSNKGYNAAAACGILGNMEVESAGTWDPEVLNPDDNGGPSYGLCQWHDVTGKGGRYTSLRDWCSQNNEDYKTVEGQIAYLLHELDTSHKSAGEALKQVNNDEQGAYTAGYKFCELFEVPADIAGQAPKRGENAKKYFKLVENDKLVLGGSVAEQAVQWALAIAEDSDHGYSQAVRTGPDYDCSSFVAAAYANAGVDILETSTTHTMESGAYSLESIGFIDVTSDIDLSTGQGLQLGDIVWKSSHVEMVSNVNPYELVGAHRSENGGKFGKLGDQDGREICTNSYYNSPWTRVFRYNGL